MKKKLLHQALKIARSEHATHPEWQNYMHWTFIVQHNQLLEWGTNVEGDPPPGMGYHQRAKIHSELRAYRRGKGLLDRNADWSIINVRLSRQGEIKISAPCETCVSWLSAVGARKAAFTTPSGWASLKLDPS